VAILALGAKPYQLGLLAAAEFAAFPILGLFAGVWADRLPRRAIMIVADVGRALVLATVPVAYVFGKLSLVQLYAVALITGVLTVFFDVSYQSYLPVLVGREQLVGANARLEFTRSAAQVGGNGVAGVLIQVLGAPMAVVLDALSFLVSVASLALIRTREVVTLSFSRRASMLSEIREGVGVVFGNPILRSIAACTATFNLGTSIVGAVLLLFAYRQLHMAPAVVGGILAASNLGFIGAAFAPTFARKLGLGRVLVMSAFAGGLALLALPLALRFVPVVVLLVSQFVLNVTTPIYNVNQVSLRQTIVPDALQGRMNATMRTIVWGTLPLGSLIGGALGSAVGIVPALIIGGATATLSAIWIVASPVRRLQAVP
jgi:hypothetical protein